jgi:DNA-binding response OmpR family regulator
MKLLLVDDDRDLIEVTAFALQQAGFLVVKADSFAAGLEAFRGEAPGLALLDINLPGGSGFDLCAMLRAESALPIMMLTVRGEESDLVRALELGADDYLTKPFSPRTLVARVRALLRRAGQPDSPRTRAGALELLPESLTLAIDGQAPVRLTPLECRLLQMLMARPGQATPTDRLLLHVWGHRGGGDRQLLKQLVHRLRQKIGDHADEPRWIETVPGVGYRLRINPGESPE